MRWLKRPFLELGNHCRKVVAVSQGAVLHLGLQEGLQRLQLLPLQPRHHMASPMRDDYRVPEHLRQLQGVLHGLPHSTEHIA